MIQTLAKQIKQYKRASILTVVFTIGEVLFEILIPYMMSKIIDQGIQAGNLNQVLIYGGIMILLAVCGLACGVWSGRYGAEASSGFACNLRDAMYTNIQTFSFSNIDKYSTAGLVTRLTTDVTNIQNSFQMVLRMMMRAPATLCCALAMTVIISPELSSIFFIAILFLGVILLTIMSYASKAFQEVFKKYDDLNASVQENITGIRVVKSFVREEYEIGKFDQAVNNLYKLFVKAESKICLNGPVMLITVYSCILALSWFGAHMIVGGSLTTGQLTSLFSYVMNILMSLMMLSMVFVMITMSEASAKRIAEILNEKTDIETPENALTDVKDGSIEFKDVNFAYRKGSGKYVLNDINLSIHSGETIGMIGGTGSSKSSLVNLISRLYDATEGTVFVGGEDVKKYDLEVLRDSVSVVLQKNELFSGTILDNLRWGNEQASQEECERVCRLACADEFIQRFPDKYNTWIEQGGNNVSGGQKQRLCIARALLKNPKILILDDSTSAVDTATDALIRKAFREEIPDITKIIIAQRISSIQDADRILVLDNGVINGFDTHENLLKNNEIYQSVADGQLDGSGDFDKTGA